VAALEGWKLIPVGSRRIEISIQDEASLAEASDAMHDAIFDQDDILFDEARSIFRVTVWREVPELAKRERVLLLLHRLRMPRVRSVLEFVAVRRAVVKRTDNYMLGGYCLDEIEYNPTDGLIKLRIMGPLVVELEVEHLIGSLKDIGDPTWDAPSISTFGIGP
jgi:hypothetical protein